MSQTVLSLAVVLTLAGTAGPAIATERPNILWISCEDTSPDLGCYGDKYAHTPNLDRLAAQGARFTSAFTVAGVCAPSRSGIITGMYPCSIGTHHMRSKGVPPAYVKCFPEYLRAAGYYCTNNVKTDYNFDAPVTAWDECNQRAHWRNRRAGQPFFAVFNFTTTHESQIRDPRPETARLVAALSESERHDPLKAALPPYYPDTPIVRKDWANYYDLVTAMDKQAADLLKQLEQDDLADNTVVFFWGDHGRGLPRAKRWVYDSGIHAPLIIRWPGHVEPGSVRNDLVSFLDFGPTVLSIAGVPVPKYMQGRPFLGTAAAEPRKYIFAARDRMDETYDIIRCVRDSRYKLIRNFKPGRPYAQYIDYGEKMPTLQEMRRLNKEGKLTGAQTIFFLPEKPPEELYDLQNDPHEVRNLIDSPELADVRDRLRAALKEWMDDIHDLALVPEPELKERMRPSGKWATTEVPQIRSSTAADGGALVSITCVTEGASIAYAVESAAADNSRQAPPGAGTRRSGAKSWLLYTAPVTLPAGTTIRAKACRLGYLDSPESRVTIGEQATTRPTR